MAVAVFFLVNGKPISISASSPSYWNMFREWYGKIGKEKSVFLVDVLDCCICYCKVCVIELLLLSENKDMTGKIVSTGIDSLELQGLDVVQCAALVETNHGIVNLIMNEYACYGKRHTINSSGQIEWFKNSVDDRSVQVGGKQRICTVDGFAMPLTCRGGLMYLSILG